MLARAMDGAAEPGRMLGKGAAKAAGTTGHERHLAV